MVISPEILPTSSPEDARGTENHPSSHRTAASARRVQVSPSTLGEGGGAPSGNLDDTPASKLICDALFEPFAPFAPFAPVLRCRPSTRGSIAEISATPTYNAPPPTQSTDPASSHVAAASLSYRTTTP